MQSNKTTNVLLSIIAIALIVIIALFFVNKKAVAPVTTIDQTPAVAINTPTTTPVVTKPATTPATPATPAPTGPTPTWQSFNDPATGIKIQYPSLNGMTLKPQIAIAPQVSLDANGCVPQQSGGGSAAAETLVTIHGITFCRSIGDDSGMGASGTTYVYTFSHGIQHYSLSYPVVVHNCSNYDIGTPGYQTCLSNNSAINSLEQFIATSLATLSF